MSKKYTVRYQVVNPKGPPPSGCSSTIVTADNMFEARQVFNAHHIPSASAQYRILSVTQTGS